VKVRFFLIQFTLNREHHQDIMKWIEKYLARRSIFVFVATVKICFMHSLTFQPRFSLTWKNCTIYSSRSIKLLALEEEDVLFILPVHATKRGKLYKHILKLFSYPQMKKCGQKKQIELNEHIEQCATSILVMLAKQAQFLNRDSIRFSLPI